MGLAKPSSPGAEQRQQIELVDAINPPFCSAKSEQTKKIPTLNFPLGGKELTCAFTTQLPQGCPNN